MSEERQPYTPFRPVDRATFEGHPMPTSVAPGVRLELSRARLMDGCETNLDDWMQMLHDRYDECQDSLGRERAALEATFKHVEADGSVWMYHFSLIGEASPGLDTSFSIDADHEASARRTKEAGWEELQPKFLLAPQHILDAITTWSLTGEAAPEE